MFAGGADLGDDVLADALAVLIKGADEAHARSAVAGHCAGHVEIAEGSDHLPLLAHLLQDLELFETFQSRAAPQAIAG